MLQIKYIVIHCSATERGKDFGAFDIDQWHRHRGFTCIGYHFVIRINGDLEKGRVLGTVGAHTYRFNNNSVGICYVGGLDGKQPADTRTEAQCVRMEMLVKELLQRYPHAQVCGHRDLTHDRDCPCFDVAEWARSVGIPEKRIYHDE